MTRTWSLNDTLALGGSLIVNESGFIAVNDARDLMFFFDDTGQQVWSWADDGTLTDISDTEFNGADDQILDICWYDGDLYVVYIYNASNEGKVAKWDGVGMTTWTDVWTINQGGTAGVFASLPANMQFLDADDDRIVVAGFTISGGDRRIASSTDGSSFTIETVESSSTYAYLGIVYGHAHGGATEIYVLTDTASKVNRVCTNDGAGNWEQVNPDAVHSAIIIFNAVAAGLSFWFASSPYRIDYSTDFGETFASTGLSSDSAGALRTSIITLTNGSSQVVMVCDRTDEQAYTWDENTLAIVADGTTGTDTIVNFFVLGDTLYALCNDHAVTGQALVYEGGDLPAGTLELWVGTDGPGASKKSDLPFNDAKFGVSMGVTTSGRVAVGRRGAAGVAEADSDDSYATWTDRTASLANDAESIDWDKDRL